MTVTRLCCRKVSQPSSPAHPGVRRIVIKLPKLELIFALLGYTLCLIVVLPTLLEHGSITPYLLGLFLSFISIISTTRLLSNYALSRPDSGSLLRRIPFGIFSGHICLFAAAFGFCFGNLMTTYVFSVTYSGSWFGWPHEFQSLLFYPIMWALIVGTIPCTILGTIYGTLTHTRATRTG